MGGEFDGLGPYTSMRRIREASRRMSAAVFIAAGAAAVVLLVKGLYPADLPGSPSPDFIDTIFDNRGVLWAARLLLISAAGVLAVGGVFIVVSIGIRMRNGEWLRRAGPFEVSEGETSVAEGDADFWREAALASQRSMARLQEQLKRYEALADDLRGK